MNAHIDAPGLEDKALLSKYRNLPFLFLFPLFTGILCLVFSLAAALFSPAYMPKSYVEGYSLFDQLIPIIIGVALVGGALLAYWRSTATRVFGYGDLSAEAFKNAFLPKLTAAEGWSIKNQSEKYYLFQRGGAFFLLAFEPEGMLVRCPLRRLRGMKALAARVEKPTPEAV